MLSCAFELIRSFPNLQTLDILTRKRVCIILHVFQSHIYSFAFEYYLFLQYIPKLTSSAMVDYSTMELLQLRSVNFIYCEASESEVCLIKYILASSPTLKKIIILPGSTVELHEKFMFARNLLKLRPASPIVDIDLY